MHLGTCGISSGANRVLDAFQKEIEKRELTADVVISKAACIGQCGREPVATVIHPAIGSVIYCDLSEDKIPDIVLRHLIGGHVLTEWTLDTTSPLFTMQETRIMRNQDMDPMEVWL